MTEFIEGAYQYCLNVGLYTHTLACTFVQSSKCMYNQIYKAYFSNNQITFIPAKKLKYVCMYKVI